MKLRSTYSAKGFPPLRVAWVWSMVFIGIILYAMTWFMFGRIAMEVITAIESTYTFLPPWDSAVAVLKAVIAYHPIIAMIGWIIWGFLNSARREPRAYAEY